VVIDTTAEQLISVEAAEILAIRRRRMRRVRLRWSDVGWRLRWVNQVIPKLKHPCISEPIEVSGASR